MAIDSIRLLAGRVHTSPTVLAEFCLVAITVLLLIGGGFIYLIARLGMLRRLLTHCRPTTEALEGIHDSPAPPLTVLVPSYKEETRVVRQTVLSAALLEYPDKRVVLLIDDPPTGTPEDLHRVAEMHACVAQLDAVLSLPARRLGAARDSFERRSADGTADPAKEAPILAQLYGEAADWLEVRATETRADSAPAFAHVDAFFIEHILLAPARQHRARAASIRSGVFKPAMIGREYRRLASLFDCRVSSFERKRFANLSHEPNKAMNLNAYIGLIGGSFHAVEAKGETRLEPCAPPIATLVVPETEYLLTLDADSLVMPDYALLLTREMERDPRIAVAQTPYSAFPHARTPTERIAGATTDLQYFVHQGLTAQAATFWVGANALLRLAALRDIQQTRTERGCSVPVFVDDGTAIEDTASTIDLLRRGWTLFNYPSRMSYSATPPDFGALIIQRRRWSNGGLIILPNLIRYATGPKWRRPRMMEMVLRTHYLSSPLVANGGILLLLLFPFEADLVSPLLPLTALPYFIIYSRDLRLAGYSHADLWRVYALNMLLIPVNLSGVLASLHQALRGRKAVFARTPKVEDRTTIAPSYVLVPLGLVALLAFSTVWDLLQSRYAHASFAFANALFLLYAMGTFVGWKAAWSDVRTGWNGHATMALRQLRPAVGTARNGR